MFCPRCSTENGSEPSFCRQCGLLLTAVSLALEGRVDEALSKLKRGSGSLSGGAIILVIGLLNALANGYFAAWQSAIVSAVLGSAIGVPLMVVGMVRVSHAKRLLNLGDRLQGLPGERVSDLLSGEPTRRLNQEPTAPGPVTEHTTLKLESSKSTGRE